PPRPPIPATFSPTNPPTRKSIAAPGPVPDFDMLLAEARPPSASDLHIVALRPPLFRLAGELVPAGVTLDPQSVEQMLLPIIPPRLRSQFQQDGSCDFAIAHPVH